MIRVLIIVVLLLTLIGTPFSCNLRIETPGTEEPLIDFHYSSESGNA